MWINSYYIVLSLLRMLEVVWGTRSLTMRRGKI